MKKLDGLVLGSQTKHKKDYESLMPFKFFCESCSFKTKRRSHYLKHCQLHKQVRMYTVNYVGLLKILFQIKTEADFS